MNENLRNLYNTLISNGYNPPAFEQFVQDMQDENNLRGVYNTLQKEGYKPPKFDTFKTDMGYVSPQAQQQAQPAKPVGQVDVSVNAGITPNSTVQQPTWKQTPEQQRVKLAGLQHMTDSFNQRMEQQRQDFHTKMDNMKKVAAGHSTEYKFNPMSGKMERTYYTDTGKEVSTRFEQSRINTKAFQDWEANTPEGQQHREWRIKRENESRLENAINKYDPENAAAAAWDMAQERTREAREQHNKEIWDDYTNTAVKSGGMLGGREMRVMTAGKTAHSNLVDYLTYHDLQRMADDAWSNLGVEKQQKITIEIYNALKNLHPEATEEQLAQTAREMARQQSDQRLFELAVEKNAPQSATDMFFRKAIGMNSVLKLTEALARSSAGTTGDWEAREVAESRFENDGHKVASVSGTVVGFVFDPLTILSAGAGSGAVRGATWAGGRLFGQAAVRKFGTTLGGRLAAGAIGGAANFGTYEAGSETVDQLRWGGYIDEETGERKEGFSLGNVGERFGHGLMMGAATGVVAPLLGNVSDKLVRATESTVGKAGIRVGELGVGTVAEGTIFSIPEWIEGDRDAMDVWTDNMAMMAGFRGMHMIKSAPRVIGELSAIDKPGNMAERTHNRMGFEGRLRKALDGTRPDLALTADEKAELERGGYGDLNELVEDYGRYEAKKAQEEAYKGKRGDVAPDRLLEEGELPDGVYREIPYNRFTDLMTDGNISEAARAKMYYYLTGHTLPMSTVIASSDILENKDADGNVKSYTVQSYGGNGVITSRTFTSRKAAEAEQKRIDRQAELNALDVGERYFDRKGDYKRMEQACKEVAKEIAGDNVRFGENAYLWRRLYELMQKKPEDMSDVERKVANKIFDAYDKLGDEFDYEQYTYESNGNIFGVETERVVTGSKKLREDINHEFGVDIDKAVKKEPFRRSGQEQKAVEEYAKRLFADVKFRQEEAARNSEPRDPNAPTTNSQTAALLGFDDSDPADPSSGMSAPRRRGYNAGMQERRDIAIELADPNNADNPDVQEAWNGVVQRINEDAAYMAALDREQAKQMQHSDGSIRPATLKEADDNGNPQQVYIVDGHVNMMPDGSRVDPATSDKSIVIYNPATGERTMIDPTSDTGLATVGEVTTVAEHEAKIEANRRRAVQGAIDAAQGTVRVVPGEQMVLPTGEPAVVVAVDDSGENITVRLNDGTQQNVLRSELQRIADEAALLEYRQRHGIADEPTPTQPESIETPAQAQPSGVIEGAPAEYAEGMELTVRDDDGTEKPAMVMGMVRAEGGKLTPDPNGKIVEFYMDGEVKHSHIDNLNDKVVSHVPLRGEAAPQAPAADGVQPLPRPVIPDVKPEDMTDEAIAAEIQALRDYDHHPATLNFDNELIARRDALLAEQERRRANAPVAENEMQPADTNAGAAEPQPAAPIAETVPPQPTAPLEQQINEPMPMRDDGEEDWHAVSPERSHHYIFNGEAGLDRNEANQFVANMVQDAKNGLVKAKSAKMPNMGKSIKKYNEAKAQRQAKIEEAQRNLDYWNSVRDIQNRIAKAEAEERAAQDAAAHDAAVAQAQAEYEARKQAEAERKAVGNENPMPAITEKWNTADKVDGHRDEIVLPNGERVKGHYVLHESGTSSPSHNSETWAKTDGFPMDVNDNSVNDRDYERDKDAQKVTEDIARQYDQRALQTPVVVSQDGVVLSGNGRTIAGEIAAKNNTDGAYIDYLKEYAHKFGFTPEQVEAMQHPRVSFVPDEAMPYTAETFAKFNQQEMKSQNKTEQAVKLGKTVSDDSFKGIVRTINGYDTLGDFYNDPKASLGAVYDLHSAGVIPQAQLAEMVDGAKGHEKLSAIGRDMLENMLIGKAFANDPDVIRMLTAVPAMRQSVITALGELADNIALGEDWSLQKEITGAVKLCYDALNSGANYGDIVSIHARQGVLFADPDELQTAADFNDATMLMLADVLNDKRVTMLKTTLALYNSQARESAAGQMDIFSDGIRGREEILQSVIKYFNDNYGRKKELEAARAKAVERRKSESREPSGENEGVQQDGTPAPVVDEGEAVADTQVEPSPVAVAEQGTNTEPTAAQKEAGNYKKGHLKLDGFNISIENPKGSIRSGKDASGKEWSVTMQNTYGYIRGTEGVDGDHIDVFLSDNMDDWNGTVYVIDQVKADGSFDEHKVMYGFNSAEEAAAAYNSNYSEGWQGLGTITGVSKEEFKKWIGSSHRKTKPFADYKKVKTDEGQSNPVVDDMVENPDNLEALRAKHPNALFLVRGQKLYKAYGEDAKKLGEILGVEVKPDKKYGFVASFDHNDLDTNLPKLVRAGLRVAITESSSLKGDKPASGKKKTTKAADIAAEQTPASGEGKSGYTVEPAQYTTKRGKVLNMVLVKFGRELTTDEKQALTKLAKEKRGWWDREKGGFLMRDEATARQLGDMVGDEEAVKDNQPMSLADVQAVNDAAAVQAVDEAIKVEEKPQSTPQYDYDREDEVYDQVLAGLRETLNNANGNAIPNIKAIEKKIRELRKRAKTIEDGMATAAGETIPQAFDALANLNGRRKAYEQFLVDIRKKMAETERDDALAAHGVKLGDKIMYKGKEVTIHDADARQVTLDVGLSPVLYEVTDWENVELPKQEPTTPQVNEVKVESLMGELNERGEAKLSDHATPVEEEQPQTEASEPANETANEKSEYGANNRLVSRDRYEEIKRRMRKKMGGQANMGLDPELIAMGAEMAVFHIEAGARKFVDFAKRMIADMGDSIRPYLKMFYNSAREMPEAVAAGLSSQMDDYATVSSIDVANLDKPTVDAMATAEQIVNEQRVEQQAEEATNEIIKQRNADRKEEEKERSAQEKSSKSKKNKKNVVTSQQRSLFGDLYGEVEQEAEQNNDSNDNTRTTRQAENISRADGTVGSVPAGRDGILDTRSSGQTDRGETASVSDGTGAVADGERNGIPGRRSSGNATRGDLADDTNAGGLSDGGRGLRNGEPTPERNDNRGTAEAAGTVPSRTGDGTIRGGDRAKTDERPASEQGGDEVRPSTTERPSVTGTAGDRRGEVKQSPKTPEPKFKRNYLYPENSSEIDNMSPSQRLTANVEALEVLRNLMREGREATPEEREILGRYRGWGGVDIIDKAYSTDSLRYAGRYSTESRDRAATLKRLADVIDELDPDEKRGVLSAIRHAALTSFYTPTAIARVMNRFMELAGFKGGSMLDPSMGNGIFEGTMSKGVQQRTMIHGIELDWLTGQLARHLYPDANVLVTGYEDAGTADNAYDIVVSNIPFGQFGVTDKSWKHDSSPVRKAAQNRIHNYFAVKMLDNTRPGGLCVVMTSNAILDTKGNQIIREHLADNAEILGIVRLPDNTFKGAGTSVVTDVIFMRKYKDDADRAATRGDDAYVTAIEQPFLSSGEMKLTNPTDGKTYQVTVNSYFLKNKGMMIGDAKAGGQYRGDEFGLTSTMSTDELASAMSKLIDKKIVGDRKGKLFDTHKTAREVHQAVSEAYKGDGTYISSGNIVEQDGMIGIVTSTKGRYGEVSSTFTEMPSLKGKANRIRAMIPIRKAMKQVIDMQIQGESEKRLAEARAELQKAYDDFVKKFGRLNDKENDFLTEDIDGFQLRALERYKGKKFDGLSDIFTKNTIKPALDLTTARTPHDAISLSLAEYGEINPAYMEDILGSSWVEQCGGTLFKTPFTDDAYETADAYLSGDVKTKLEQAREAAKQDPTYQRNVEALEAVQPKDIPFTDINIRMGARWIPSEIYTDFMNEMFGIRRQSWRARENKSGVSYLPEADQFIVNVDKKELGGEADAWRTSRLSPSEIFAAALEDKTRRVYDTIEVDGVERKVINKEETELANNKIQDLRTMFEDWLGHNPEREELLTRLYNDKFNRTVLRKFDGSHLNVAGLMGMELRPHQKDAVWMLINNRGGIIDHIVGAGKTLVMQSAIMEMRRMGIAKKPMIIALKATVGQIAKEFREAFPAARILAPTERDFEAKNRKKLLAQIAVNDYDCVILSHDNYNQLPHTEEVERAVIDEQMSQLDAAIEYLYGTGDKSQLTKKQIKGLEKRKANLEAKLKSLLDRKIDREFTFEGLGVDYLFVDECQHYKSLPYVSTYDRVAGLGDKKGSQRAVALLNGVRYLQKLHQGDRGTVFLSGTTISNSLSEIYHLLNYLRPSELQRMGLTTFDAWAGNFAVHTAELEYGVTNELKEKDRFRSLTNIPELATMYSEISDVRNDMNLKLPKPKMRSHIVAVPQSDVMKEINAAIVEMVKTKDGHFFGITSNDKTPWGLLASTLSAKAAINPRLIDEVYADEGGKIPAVCENVKKIYDQFHEQKGTQLIFCDTGVPTKGKKYDAYTDIINRLVNDYGIPRNEIADIHEADNDEKRKALFARVNEGTVRILIGGTKNMGTGVNVQMRITAMHHVDVPWTPADREQREGRGVRQGNIIARDFNDNNVDVYFYATEGSLDMYKYQLQETKGKLFTQFKSGTVGERTFDEGDAEGDFDAAEVVATLSGNPVIFEKSKQDKKVEKLRRAKRAYESDWQRRMSRFEELKQKRDNYERLLRLNAEDVRSLERGGFVADEEGKYPSKVAVSIKDDYASRREFDKPKEAGAYIHELLSKGKVVQLSGYGQKATITRPITDAGLFGKPIAQFDSYSYGGGIKYTVEVSDDDTAAGVAFRNLLQKVYSNRKVYERNMEEIKSQLVGADPGEKVFPNQAELDEALEVKKRLDEEYKKLSDEEDKPKEPTLYRIREDEPPKNTGIGYKVFVLKDGKLYPPMVANPNGEPTPVGVWLDADAAPVAGVTKTGRQQVKAGGKGTQGGSGKLAYRPGWHLGEIPYAMQFNRKNPTTGQRELFPANFVWAEVEYANDVDYTDEARSYGVNPSGKYQHSLAGLPRVPENGSYKYRTNPDPKTEPWIITGAMKVKRILTPSEVDNMVRAAGREPQPRQEGAVTDEQVNALNGAITRTMQEDASMKRRTVEQMGKRLNTPIKIYNTPDEVTHSDPDEQARRRKSKGWYDPNTREIGIVLSNNADVDDVKASVGHETIAHHGLRELVGEERYNEFLDEVYDHLDEDLKKGIDEKTNKAFYNDVADNGEQSRDYEQHRRQQVDELFGEMAEKPFDEFSEGERTLWQKIKASVRRLLDKFLGSLKLPKWFTLGDNELRYMLWRSKERLEHGKEHPIDLAHDIVKRDELGLNGDTRYAMGDAPETFRARQQRAVSERGVVMPGLNEAEVKVVDVPFHQYKGHDAITQARVAAVERYSKPGNGKKRVPLLQHYNNFGSRFDYVISPTSLKEAANHAEDSENIGVHIAVMDKLHEVINESIEIEEHPDVKKINDERKWENGFNDGILMHRFAGAVRIGNDIYRVKITMKEYEKPEIENGHYTYEVIKIEVMDEQPNTSDGRSNVSDVFVSGAKLLKKLEKSYDEGKNLLEESKKAENKPTLYRPGDTDDIWNDMSLGLDERITAAATRLANNHRANRTMRDDAMRAIGGNLTNLRRAMSLQRKFDMTTVKRVADLARVLMDSGHLDGLSATEVKRLLAAVRNSVGHNDIEASVQRVMDIMVDNQLKKGEATLHELETIKATTVDARGVEVQGQLDPAGAHTIKVFKKSRGWEKADIEEAIADAQQRMGSNDVAVADEAALDYTGLQFALEYNENIKASKVEEHNLREELRRKHDETSEADRATTAYKQYVESVHEAIRQNKIDRAQAYFDLVSRLSDSLRGSIANAQAFKEAEKQRIREIQHNANSDMQGRPSDEHYKPTFMDKFVNNSFVSFAFAPLATFDQMLRLFGNKSVNGEGYLYNRFMRGWVDARQKEIRGVREKFATLDAKAKEMFGGKVKTWGDLIRRVGKLPKATVSFWNGGEMQEHELSQGNLMYIYMVDKMLDGRMKLRSMGISEDDVANIEATLDPRLIELADWLQEEFLVNTRNEYNETHKRMFGASMAAIEDYFPLKILENALTDKAEDLDNPFKGNGISTATGAIIKRRRNNKALDITHADALSVVLDHIAEMEHWNAFAEFNRDLNTLRTYKRFRNQVQNMTTVYGSGKELWRKFNDVCQMAAGTYRPPRAKLDETALNFAKGVTAAKVSLRLYTALKQFLSFPAYLPEARPDYLVANLATPWIAWNWCMENLPIFNERWKSRIAGDPRLMKSDMDWKLWRTRIMQIAQRVGMSPNAFVDALTVCIGTHAMYQTRVAQYKRDGYDEATAEARAKQDAEVLYNQTQQSSEGAFTSTMQVDRSWLSVLFTVFRNSPMSYQRQLHDALRNLKRNLSPGGYAKSIEFMKKQMVRDGLDEDTAEASAKRKFRRQIIKDLLRVATFGYIMQLAWNLGSYLPYILFGDDDDEKNKMWDNIFAKTYFGSVEGLTGGDVISEAGRWAVTGDGNAEYMDKDMPVTSDIMAIFKKLGYGKGKDALTDIVNLVVQSGIGVNPQSITDGVLGIMDACGDDPELAHEAAICVSRILQVPQSQIDKMYFDEVGLSGSEVSKYTPTQLAERYARYKVKRGHVYSPWTWDDEGLIDKQASKAKTTIKERVGRMGEQAVNDAYLRYEEVYKGVNEKVKAAKETAKTDYVEAARMMQDLQNEDMRTYQAFKQLDGQLDKIAKNYLNAKTPEEAALCLQTIIDYKKAMVNVLGATDIESQAAATRNLSEIMQNYMQKYTAMQPQLNR